MGILALDDTDSSIAYSVGWNKAGSALEYNKTTTWTVVAGSTAKIAFQGTSIGVYGTVSAKSRRSIAPISAYSIDGGALSGFTAVQAAKAQYSQLFYQSPTLPEGAHVLTITNTVVADPLFLDFLLVAQTADSTASQGIPGLPLPTGLSNSTASLTSSGTSSSSTSSSSSIVSTSAPITSSAVPVTITVTSTAASSTVNSADAANASSANAASDKVGGNKKSNAGPIVGGILGAVCVLILLAFGFVWWNRKRQRRNSVMSYQAAGSGSYWSRPLAAAATPHSDLQAVNPYTVAPSPPPPPPPNMTQNYAPSTNSATTNSGYGQTRYPGGYTPGADYYESSDLAYAVNPAPTQGGGYIPPSQLMNQNTAVNNNNNGYSDYNGGYTNSGYNPGNDYSHGAAPYSSQGGYGTGYNNGGYPPPEPQRQPAERVRVRLD